MSLPLPFSDDWREKLRPPERHEGRIERPAPRERRRRGRLSPRNEERAAKKHDETFGPCSRAGRALGCVVPRCGKHLSKGDTIHAAHVRSRGASGKDWSNVVGLCEFHHRQQGDVGIKTFQRKHNLSLEVAASHIADAVRDHACASWKEPDPRGGWRCLICLKAIDTRTP
jgi:hypothetical protein